MPSTAGLSGEPLGLQPLEKARRVLVVDDNQDLADSLGMLLQLGGHQVRVACDGEHAIEEARQLRPEIMLLDLGMPGMDGFETCRRIRQEDWGKLITIVALTGWSQPTDCARSRDAGFDMHWTKPVDLCALGRLLAGTPMTTPPAEHH
jgi:CheY-like chemotaxis protein